MYNLKSSEEVIIIWKKLILGLIIFLTLSCAYASDVNVTDNSTDILVAPVIPDEPDKPDLVENETI